MRANKRKILSFFVGIFIGGSMLTFSVHTIHRPRIAAEEALEFRTAAGERFVSSSSDAIRPVIKADRLLQRERNAIPNNVYMVWCGKARSFEFRHYLSVLSIVRYIEPDNIVLLYNNDLPTVDKHHYYTWLTELEAMFPFFQKRNNPKACDASAVEELIRREGGIYVHENVVLTRSLAAYMTHRSFTAKDRTDGATVVHMVSGGYLARSAASSASQDSVDVCQRIQNPNGAHANNTTCLVLENPISPKDIWEVESDVGRVLRTVAYGKPEMARPVPDYSTLVPNIAHVIWIGGGRMQFDFLLCVLSLLHVAKVDTVYIHGEAPHGFYWDLVKNSTKIKIIHRTFAGQIFGDGRITRNAHISDVVRADTLRKYGGIYVDVDAYFVRPLSREIRAYEAAASVDITPAYNTAYPDVVQNGVMIAKPGARFFHLHVESMKNFYPDDYFWIGLRSAYKVKERHPDTLRLEPHLQLMCYSPSFLCRPTWLPDYGDQSVSYFASNKLNWTADFNVLHVPYPRPGAFQNHKNMLADRGVFGEIGRHIVRQSGLLELFGNLPVPK